MLLSSIRGENIGLLTTFVGQEFLLDCLDSLPRLQVSDAQMRAFLFVLNECGVPNVPSLATLRREQKRLRSTIGTPTVRHESMRGNVFYVNDIGDQIAKACRKFPSLMGSSRSCIDLHNNIIIVITKDFANPIVRPFINV